LAAGTAVNNTAGTLETAGADEGLKGGSSARGRTDRS
jgi:hypothetical protein